MADSLADLVAGAREQAGLTLREVAEKSAGALSFQTVHAIEAGRTNVSTEKLDALADVLGLSRRRVREAAGREPGLGPFVLPEGADLLDREERAAVLAVVRALLRGRGE
jgi:transcriptional regulator with XRE-family HTH domain